MTRYGSIFSYWSRDWECDLIGVLENAAKSDLNCIEFHVNRTMNYSQQQIDEIKACAKELDIELLGNGGVDETCVTYTENERMTQAGIDLIKSYLEQAARFGCVFFDGGYSEAWPVQRPVMLTKELKDRYTHRVIEAIKKMVPTAADLGITMHMEIVNRFEGFLVNTCAEARYIAEQVNHPNFKVTMDTYHMNIEEDSIEGGIMTLGKEFLGHVHLGESNRKLPGQGTQVDWDKVFGGLKKIGYDKRLLLEPFTLPYGTVGNNVFLWRDLTGGASEEQMIQEMKEAVAFVKSIFES